MRLRAGDRALRVGHKGAPVLAPENTLRSFERAIELGVDLVEFDVLDLEDGTLVLAHSDDLHEVSHGGAHGRVRARTLAELRRAAPELPTLDEALALIAEAGVGIHADLKWHGFEAGVVEALRRHGVVDRAVVSSFHTRSLREVAALEPGLARGLTYPYDRHGVTKQRLLEPAVSAALAGLRRTLPLRIGRMLDGARASAAMLHHSVVSHAAVERCHARGAAVFAWTVNDAALLGRMLDAGVDAVITDDPRIFRI